MDDWTWLRTLMEEAGCDRQSIRRAETLCELGAGAELLACLRSCRCDQLELLHEKQRQLDRLDLLIRKTQQQIRSA